MNFYQTKYSLDQRQKEANRVLLKHQDRIPIIIIEENKNFKLINKKMAVPKDMTILEFIHVIRNKVDLHPSEALCIFMGKERIIPLPTQHIAELYSIYKDEDGFLYCYICKEESFGF